MSLYSDAAASQIKKLDNGTFQLKVPVPDGWNGKKLKVNYFNPDGSKEEYEVVVENNYMTFNVKHFSTYVISEKSEDVKAGDSNTTVLMIAVIISLTAGTVLAYRKKKLYCH